MNTPFISIIIPIRNEEAYIDKCLDAVLAQDYPREHMEIIVVDGLSTDNTREIISKYEKEHGNIRLLDNPGKIVPKGMNIALRQARGEIIVRVDGHCVIARDYVTRCVEHLERDRVDGVGGPMASIGETSTSQTIALAMSSTFGVGNSAFRTSTYSRMLVDTIPFPAYTKTITEKAGYYDEELVRNQDDEYNYRIRELGGKLLLAEDVRSIYYARGDMGKLWKQYFQYGFYKVRVLQKHPSQMSLRQFIPPLFVLSLILALLLSVVIKQGWIILLSILGMYFIANLTASIILGIKNGSKHTLWLPVAYVIIHLSYGVGFLFGLIKFWNRWGDKEGLVPESGGK